MGNSSWWESMESAQIFKTKREVFVRRWIDNRTQTGDPSAGRSGGNSSTVPGSISLRKYSRLIPTMNMRRLFVNLSPCLLQRRILQHAIPWYDHLVSSPDTVLVSAHKRTQSTMLVPLVRTALPKLNGSTISETRWHHIDGIRIPLVSVSNISPRVRRITSPFSRRGPINHLRRPWTGREGTLSAP